ncbi:MAG: GHKL domain-containing protein [Calditrichae bacterium]|nr:GHKL domain-containing protein [Calditrichota bacterium]MCB9057027.1 GHKL domain-containing protein [Calditrichia bacterium]
MLQEWLILAVSFIYISILFFIAYYGDKRADEGRSIISNPYFYALSLAVYCSAWTFYGSVGHAANTGLSFLTIYIGPTLMAPLWWVILRKMIRISKRHHITSIADFISSRYGKSTVLGGTVTVIAVMGIVPYISLQLKAISSSYLIISHYPDTLAYTLPQHIPVIQDTAFYVTVVLALFAILFGTRNTDATERHEGLVAAIAFESVVKLLAFLLVGVFVTYTLFNGFSDIFAKALNDGRFTTMFNESADTEKGSWFGLILISMFAILFLPRQFQLAVVENVDEDHIRKAIWLFPLYLLIINIFVVPIAMGGLIHFQTEAVDADTFVLTLPLAVKQTGIALVVFIGGLSAATGMVVVASVALSTMVSNDLLMPILLGSRYVKANREQDLRGFLLLIRRGTIIIVLFLGYFYYKLVGSHYSLVNIGLISFAAVAQFAPSFLGGMFWKGGTRYGALSGLLSGFFTWGYTLAIPSLVSAGILPESLITEGFLGLAILKPTALFGLTGLDPIMHALFWSLLFNTGSYFIVSIFVKPSAIELSQATLFVDINKYSPEFEHRSLGRGTAPVAELRLLLRRFIGEKKSERLFKAYARKNDIDLESITQADSGMINLVEKRLSGVIGSASARIMISSLVKEKPVSLDEVMHILDETQQIVAYSHELERKSSELQEATRKLKKANEKLKTMDQFKDDFIATITHELRTPLTSVRAFSEILYDNPEIDVLQRQNFLGIIIKETERLTRLINQILDLQKIESQEMEWHFNTLNIAGLIKEAIEGMQKLFEEKNIKVSFNPDHHIMVKADRDRLLQVILNLLSNAFKFCNDADGEIVISMSIESSNLVVSIQDNGIGINEADQKIIFEKFRQAKTSSKTQRHAGSGLGLSIARQIIEAHNGKIWVESKTGEGAVFKFTLPNPVLKEQEIQK